MEDLRCDGGEERCTVNPGGGETENGCECGSKGLASCLVRKEGEMLNSSTEVLLGAVGLRGVKGGVAEAKKERWEIRVRGKIRAIQRLSGRPKEGVAEERIRGEGTRTTRKGRSQSQRYVGVTRDETITVAD
ncbi:unnamed protein product [Fusarium graminearum]|nr:unnamed protein product [Fusarium graminearum]